MSATQKILNLLSDQKWHCGQEINDLYIKDDRRRITDLKKMGYVIESQRCNLPGHIHNSALFMRRLAASPDQYQSVQYDNPHISQKGEKTNMTLKWFEEELKNRPSVKQLSQQMLI